MKTLFIYLAVAPWFLGSVVSFLLFVYNLYELIYYLLHPEIKTIDVGPK